MIKRTSTAVWKPRPFSTIYEYFTAFKLFLSNLQTTPVTTLAAISFTTEDDFCGWNIWEFQQQTTILEY